MHGRKHLFITCNLCSVAFGMRKALQAEQGKADMERKVSACHNLIFGEYILRKKSVFCFMCEDVGVVSMWHKNVFVVP